MTEILAQPHISFSCHSSELFTGNIKTQCDINIYLTQCSIWNNSQRKCKKLFL